jgi:hypothetical protein
MEGPVHEDDDGDWIDYSWPYVLLAFAALIVVRVLYV